MHRKQKRKRKGNKTLFGLPESYFTYERLKDLVGVMQKKGIDDN